MFFRITMLAQYASVEKTKIFAWAVSPTVQMTAVSNQVNTVHENNKLILAVPNPETVVFHDIKSVEERLGCPHLNIFAQIETCIVALPTVKNSPNSIELKDHRQLSASFSFGSEQSFDPNSSPADSCTSVRVRKNRVCPYMSREVMTIEEVREISPHIADKYANNPNIGFVVLGLKKDIRNYEPVFYSHLISGEELFIPSSQYNPSEIQDQDGELVAWDHEIVVINGELPQVGMPVRHNGHFPTMFLGMFGFGATDFCNLSIIKLDDDIDHGIRNSDLIVPVSFAPANIFNLYEYASRTYPKEFAKFNIDFSKSIQSFSNSSRASYDLDYLKRFDPETGKYIKPSRNLFDPRTGDMIYADEVKFNPITGEPTQHEDDGPYDDKTIIEFLLSIKDSKSLVDVNSHIMGAEYQHKLQFAEQADY